MNTVPSLSGTPHRGMFMELADRGGSAESSHKLTTTASPSRDSARDLSFELSRWGPNSRQQAANSASVTIERIRSLPPCCLEPDTSSPPRGPYAEVSSSSTCSRLTLWPWEPLAC